VSCRKPAVQLGPKLAQGSSMRRDSSEVMGLPYICTDIVQLLAHVLQKNLSLFFSNAAFLCLSRACLGKSHRVLVLNTGVI
jgi:hypothetical protein